MSEPAIEIEAFARNNCEVVNSFTKAVLELSLAAQMWDVGAHAAAYRYMPNEFKAELFTFGVLSGLIAFLMTKSPHRPDDVVEFVQKRVLPALRYITSRNT